MDIKLFVGDVDEFYCDAVEGDQRWAVWSQTSLPLDANDPARARGAVSRISTKLLARFDTEQEAISFVENYKTNSNN